MYVLANMWFQKLIIQFFVSIDKIVYNFISSIYDLLITIARTSIFSQADIAEFSGRIYALLTVFMVFKVTFSLIMYVVNPDDFSDKSKGVSKLATNIIISLCLLILTPYIFNYAYQLQTMILEDNTIAKLVMGSDSKTDYINTAGDEMAFITLSAFFGPNTSIEKLYDCVEPQIKDGNGEISFNPSCSGVDKYGNSNNDTTSMYELTKNNSYFTPTMLNNYVTGVNNASIGLMFRSDLATATDGTNENFIMDYKYIFSTVVGVVVILLLLTFCMDIGVRSIKLAFLQLIAPIPIISYIDPKSGKDGMFKKWFDMCVKTYLSLFVRLLALFFAIYIISQVASLKMVDLIDGSYQTNTYVAIFIIVGALMFAKQLPKILEGLGIKLDGGSFNLNPLKKLEKEAIGGKQITTGAKRLGIAAGGAALAGGASLLTGKGIRGTAKAMGKGISGGLKGEKFGKNFSSSYAVGAAEKQKYAKMKNDGVSSTRVGLENFKNKFVGMTAKDKMDDFNSSVKGIQEGYSSYYNGVLSADQIAKDFERRRKAAENSGDEAGMKTWQDAIDARVKQIQDNDGKILTKDTAGDVQLAAQRVITNGTYDKTLKYSGEVYDKGLSNIRRNTDKLIDHVNNNYSGKFDYERGGINKGDDLKTIKGKASGVERAATSSADAKKISDLYKYVETKSKK